MIKRIGLVAALAASILVSACAAGDVGAIGGGSGAGTTLTCLALNNSAQASKQPPAVVAEVSARCAIEGFGQALENEITGAGGTMTSARAEALSARLRRLVSPLAVGRIAYDMARRSGADEAEVRAVDDARAATDEIYNRVQGRLAGLIAPTV